MGCTIEYEGTDDAAVLEAVILNRVQANGGLPVFVTITATSPYRGEQTTFSGDLIRYDAPTQRLYLQDASIDETLHFDCALGSLLSLTVHEDD